MNSIIKNILKWFPQLLSFLWNKPYLIQYIEDPIDSPKNKILYVVGTSDEPWQVELLCPCGCKDKIVLPVNESTEPRWRLKTINNKPSLSPSIWRSKGCKSHFILKKGKINWY